MLSILARPHMYQISKQLLEPTRLISRHNLIYKTQKQCIKTNRGMFRRNQVAHERSSLSELFESRAFRASIGAVGGSLIFFGCSTVWTYEHLLKLRKLQRTFFNRAQSTDPFTPIRTWWKSLREHQKVFCIIGTLNLLVFCAWQMPRFQPLMYKYFTVNLASKHTFLPMLLSTFSHQSFPHLFFNMYCLYSFSSISTMQWGKESMLAFYLSAGMFGSLASILLKIRQGSQVVSLGASAAILGVIGSTCILHPDLRISILFLPFFSFTAQNALIGIIGLDLVGLLSGWRLFDHAGHLGGTLFGLLYATHGHKVYKEYCKKVARIYNRIRPSQ